MGSIRILSMAIKGIVMLFVLCYLLVQVESGELASTELSAALAENAKLRDEIESPASNAVDVKTQIFQAGYQAGRQAAKSETDAKLSKAMEAAPQQRKMAEAAPITSAAVKCSGNFQNQAQLKGTMDCETKPRDNKAENKGSACLDNLSSGKFYASLPKGDGQCKTFNGKGAFTSTTVQVLTSNQPRSGVVTKAFVAHPNKANRTVGVFGFKRVLCNKNGGQCATFKNAVCIKCPEPIFASIYEGHAKMEEKSKFIDCCVLGHKQYQVAGHNSGTGNGTMGEAKKCSATTIGTGAFTAFNDATAELKSAYQCTGDDARKALTLVSSA